MESDAKFVVEDTEALFFHPWLNVASSSIGYLLFGVILCACYKRGVLWKRAHDVLLILFCAFVIDFMEMRMHIFFLFNMHRNKYGRWSDLPTTVGACTISVWIFYSHFLITYVEAIVSIYLFTTRVIGKCVPIYAMYAGLALVFALKASLLFESFLHGKSEDVLSPHMDWPAFCTKAYTLDEPLLISKIATAATMLIAPILSLIMMFQRSKMQKESGVSAFILLVSFSTTFLVHFYLILRYTAFGKHIPSEWIDTIKMVLLAAYNVEYLRFAWFCLAAIVLVGDIRGAVLHFILRSETKPSQPIIPQTITNDNYIDDDLN